MEKIMIPQAFKEKCEKIITKAASRTASCRWIPVGDAFIMGIHVKMASDLAQVFGQNIGLAELKDMVKYALKGWLSSSMVLSIIYQSPTERHAHMTEYIGWELATRFYLKYYFR